MSAESWLTVSHVAILIGIIVTGLGGFGLFYFGKRVATEKDQAAIAEKSEEKRQGALSGQFGPEAPAKPSEYLTVIVGTTRLRISTPDYRRGYAIRPLENLCGSDYAITFRKGQDRVLVSAQVTSIDGKVVASIKDNEWEINPNNYFKRTHSSRGLEVTDNYNLPILQIEIIDESTVALRGVFISKKMVVVATENGTSMMGGPPSLDKIRDALQDLPRLFQEKPI